MDKIRGILSPLRLPIPPPGRDAFTAVCSAIGTSGQWRPGSESNRRTRLCRPLHNHSATWPSPSGSPGLLRVRPRMGSLATFVQNNKTSADRGFAQDRCKVRKLWSGKRGSNSRPQPWQGCALPTELFPPASSVSYLLNRDCQAFEARLHRNVPSATRFTRPCCLRCHPC